LPTGGPAHETGVREDLMPGSSAEARSASVELIGVTMRYGSARAVDDVTLRVSPGEFVALLGPSGSGKTSILMMVAGFSNPSAGDIRLSGKSILGVPPEHRDIGVVFQNYALFPHLRVRQNISFPLEMARRPSAEIVERGERALRLVGLQGLGERYPHELSGGQQQRVALARALVFEPRLLLMDEPLGALDKNLRQRMQQELRALHRELGTTILFVTHDQEEALALANRVAILHEGRVVQVDEPETLYLEPSSRFVASFVGDCNFLPVAAMVREDNGWRVTVGPYRGLVTGSGPADQAGRLAVRPHVMNLRPADDGDGLPGRIVDAVFLGQLTEYLVEILEGETILVRRISGLSVDSLKAGSDVKVTWAWSTARML
jgi:putative spermidine/putrescine transport system ATP-binding protein